MGSLGVRRVAGNAVGGGAGVVVLGLEGDAGVTTLTQPDPTSRNHQIPRRPRCPQAPRRSARRPHHQSRPTRIQRRPARPGERRNPVHPGLPRADVAATGREPGTGRASYPQAHPRRLRGAAAAVKADAVGAATPLGAGHGHGRWGSPRSRPPTGVPAHPWAPTSSGVGVLGDTGGVHHEPAEVPTATRVRPHRRTVAYPPGAAPERQHCSSVAVVSMGLTCGNVSAPLDRWP